MQNFTINFYHPREKTYQAHQSLKVRYAHGSRGGAERGGGYGPGGGAESNTGGHMGPGVGLRVTQGAHGPGGGAESNTGGTWARGWG